MHRPTPRARVAFALVVAVLASASLVSPTSASPAPSSPVDRLLASSAQDPGCSPGDAPFTGVEGAALVPEVHVSRDAQPVRYVRWAGTVPSFDGLPLSVAVTVPCPGVGVGAGGDGEPLPSVTMLHGFTDDRTVWEETGASDTVDSEGRPGSNSRWNNIWFASRGYVTLTYTARGWNDSCGPATPGAGEGGPPPPCADHEYWIHLDDKRWEVRDAQWLTAGLVQSGIADPDRLAITGGSYGGAPTASAALLAGTQVCGADPVPPELGEDPCAGAADGDLVPWTTPDGSIELTWAAAVPMYTFADLLRVLAPNGRTTDGWERAPASGSTTEPFGVPLAGTISGLVLVGQIFGVFAPEGAEPDVVATTDRMLAGDPFPPDEPAVADGVATNQRFVSPVSTEPQGEVPILWVQGLTDALFGGTEALAMLDHVRAADPDYPMAVFLGDVGHDYAAERQDDWDLAKEQMNAFLDHHLRPDRTPDEPAYGVGVSFTRCLDDTAAQRYVHSTDWGRLHPTVTSFASDDGGGTSTQTPGPSGAAADPISTATLPGPGSYKGCRIVEPAAVDPTVVTYDFELDEAVDLLGGAVVEIGFDATGPDAPVAVRVWDVEPDGSRQGLVTRGVYRVDGAGGAGLEARFQLGPQAYRFEEGHRLRVEVTANDEPYLLANGQPSEVTVHRLAIDLPTYDEALVDASAQSGAVGDDAAGPGADPEGERSIAPWLAGAFAAVLLAVGVAFVGRRHRTRAGQG